jgi:ABC-type glycerol-3-phosphate transport system substrate-binding protein
LALTKELDMTNYLRYRRTYSAVALILIVVLGLSGWAGNASSNRSSSKQVSSLSLKAFQGQTLNLLFKEGYEIAAIQKYKRDFEKATGTHVKIEVYDEPTARQKFIFDCTSQTGAYDITSVSFWNLPAYRPCLEPLNSYEKTKRVAWFNSIAIPQSALKIMTVNGQLYDMPHTIIGGMFFYRRDNFQKYEIKPPQTTADILAAARKLHQADPSIIPFTGRGAPTFASLGTWLGWAWGYGAKLYDGNMCPRATDPTFEKAISDLMTLMTTYGPKDAASLTFTAAGEKFSSGRAAMMFDTSGFGTIFEDPTQSKVVGKVGFTLPKGPAGKPIQWTYMEGLGISKYSKHKDLAWLFLQWRMSKQLTQKEMEDGRFDVPNLNILHSAAYKSLAAKRGLTAYTTLLPQSWDNATIAHWPFVPQFAQIGDAFMQQISAAIAGQQSTSQALSKAQAALMQISKNAGYCT